MKKIILTEQQYSYIMLKSINEENLIDESLNWNTFKNGFSNSKEYIKKALSSCKTETDILTMLARFVSIGLLTLAVAYGILSQRFPDDAQTAQQQLKQMVELRNDSVNQVNDSIHNKKVEEVQNLMDHVAQLHGLDKSVLSADNIVTQCEKHDYYLPLLLAQAQLESNFGITDRCNRTNNVFSIGLYDNGENAVSYGSKDESIEGYIKVMKKYFLKGKTINKLLQKGGFVNQDGYRYASDPDYEQKVSQIMNGLVKRYCPTCFEN